MKTCPACGRQYGDDVTVCPEDDEPLGAVTIAGAEPDPETVVRPRRAQPIAQPRFTEISLERPAPADAEPDVRRTGVPDRVYRDEPRSAWPAVAAVTIVVAAAVVFLVYYMLSQQSGLASEVGAQITEARVAVADARARLESLPAEAPLRQRLLSLQQWDRELQGFEVSGERTREMASRAREILAQARTIAEEARVAGATVPAAPPVVPPATEEPPAGDGAEATNSSPSPESTVRSDDPAPGEPEPAEPPAPAATPATPPGTAAPKPEEPAPAPKPKGEAPPRPSDVKPPPPADPAP